jgi:hypothetical protein
VREKQKVIGTEQKVVELSKKRGNDARERIRKSSRNEVAASTEKGDSEC